MSLEINGSTVIINGETVAVSKKPKYKKGTAKVSSKTSLVGNAIKITQAQDFSEAFGQVTINLRNTLENIELLEGWQDKVGKNAIRIIDTPTGFTKTFNHMSVEDDVEIDFDSDEFEVMFKGGQGR